MHWLIIASVVLAASSACRKSSMTETTGQAAILEASSQGLIVLIDASKDQWVNLAFIDELSEQMLLFPAGSLSNSVRIRIRKDYDLLSGDEIKRSLNLANDLTVSNKYPTVLIEPILGAGQTVQVTSPFYWQVSAAENSESWSLLALEEAEAKRRVLRWKPSAAEQVAPSLRFDLQGFGSFQMMATDDAPLETVSGSAASGAWWGYEIDLFAAAAKPSKHAVAIWQLLFDQEGTIAQLATDGEDFELLPGLSFADSTITHPYVYDSSDESALRPWIWSERSLYGVMFTSTFGNQGLVARILQRQQWPEVEYPDPLAPAVLVGQYRGLAVSYALVSGQFQASPELNRDALEISYVDGQLKLAGRLAGFSEIQTSLQWPTDELAARLGVFQGIVSQQGKQMPLTLFVSLDRRAVGYVLCHVATAAACGDGDGAGGLDPMAFKYGMIELEP